MKLKHFAGYGTVNVERLGSRKVRNESEGIDYTLMVFRISGNHERGLEPRFHDEYTIQHWLARWFKNYKVTDYWTVDETNWCNHEEAIKMTVICRRA